MDQVLKKLQGEQLGILKVIDAFCRENNINYSLYAGTLLGAVRHQGFIPWDDDLDICMARSEYDRFIRLWEKNKIEGYVLQNKENTPAFSQSFTKIRKEHTAFLQDDSERGKYHTGIFVDVFPIDRLPATKLAQRVFHLECMLYQLYTREFIPPASSTIIKTGSQLLLDVVPRKKRAGARKYLLKKICFSAENGNKTVAIETIKTMHVPLPSNLLDEYLRLPFEDGEFMCFKNWDGYLTAKYGDYMTLPPESERTWKHHPILIDFEHDYEELTALKENEDPPGT